MKALRLVLYSVLALLAIAAIAHLLFYLSQYAPPGALPWWKPTLPVVRKEWDACSGSMQGLIGLLFTIGGVLFAILGYLIQEIQGHPKDEKSSVETQERYFPFTVYSTSDIDPLKKRFLKEYASLEYQPRFVRSRQGTFQSHLDVPFLMLTGRTGLGKTRECIELFLRLSREKGEDFTILYPHDDFDRPSDRDMPPEFSPRNLILFIDDMQGLCGSYSREDRTTDLPLRTFHDRLASTIAWIKERYSGKDYRVVLTAQDGPDQLERIRLGADVWSEFTVVQLPAIHKVARPSFIQAVAKHYGLTAEGKAIKYISRMSDGTSAGMINVIAREGSRPSRADRILRLKDIENDTFQYPQDWERKVYEPIIAPHAEWRAVFEALSCIYQIRVPTYKFLVVDLAARLYQHDRKRWFGLISLWLTRKRIAQAIRSDLIAWMFDYRGEIICPTAYTEGRVAVKNRLPEVFSSIRSVARKRDQRAALLPELPWLSRRLGLNMGLAEEALTMLKAFEKGRDFAPLLTAESQLLARLGRHKESLQAAETACKVDPRSSSAFVTLAYAQSRLGQHGQARETLQKATSIAPDDDYAWLNLGVGLSKMGLQDEAVSALQTACKLNPQSAKVWYSLGVTYDRQGYLSKSIEACKRATSLDPNDSDAWHTLGIAYDRDGQEQNAVDALRRAHQLDYDNGSICLSLSRAHYSAGETEEGSKALKDAESCFRKAADYNRLSAVGVAFSKNGEPADGVRIAKDVLNQVPDHRQAQLTLAICLNDLPGCDQEARQARKRFEEFCQTANDWFELGILLSDAGNFEEAVNAAQKALKSDPEHQGAARCLVRNLARQENREKEAQEARRQFAGLSLTADDWCEFSVHSSNAGYPEEAVNTAQKALEIDPNHLGALRSLARNLSKLENREEEAQHARKRFGELCRSADHWCDLSFLCGRAGHAADAVDAANKALEIDPDHVGALRSLARNLAEFPALKEKALQTWKHLAELEDTAGSSQATEADEALLGVRLTPDSERAWKDLAVSYRAAGRAIEAVSIAQQTVEQMPSLAPYCVAIAEELLSQEPQSIVPFMEHLVGLDSSNSLYLHLMGVARLKAGDAEKAVEALSTACEMDSGNEHYWYALGKALEKIERDPEAQRAYKKAIALAPGYKKAVRALRALISKMARFNPPVPLPSNPPSDADADDC